jgi:hypothetical protein
MGGIMKSKNSLEFAKFLMLFDPKFTISYYTDITLVADEEELASHIENIRFINKAWEESHV